MGSNILCLLFHTSQSTSLVAKGKIKTKKNTNHTAGNEKKIRLIAQVIKLNIDAGVELHGGKDSYNICEAMQTYVNPQHHEREREKGTRCHGFPDGIP